MSATGSSPPATAPRSFRRDATFAWEFVRPRVEEWYASTMTADGVLARDRDLEVVQMPDKWLITTSLISGSDA
jgi:hypothetical protein